MAIQGRHWRRIFLRTRDRIGRHCIYRAFELYAVHPDGTEKWSFGTGYFPTPAIGADGTIYVAAASPDFLYALNPNGTKKWPAGAAALGGAVSSPAIGPDGSIYVCGTDNILRAFKNDGTPKWQFATGSIVGSPIVSLDGTIFEPGSDANLYAVNPATGAEKWHFATGGFGRFPAASIGADGTVYIASRDHNLYAIK